MVEPPPAYPGQEANLGQLYLKQVRGGRGWNYYLHIDTNHHISPTYLAF